MDRETPGEVVARLVEFQRYADNTPAEIDSLVTNLRSNGEAMMRAALAQVVAACVTAHHDYTCAMSTNPTMWS